MAIFPLSSKPLRCLLRFLSLRVPFPSTAISHTSRKYEYTIQTRDKCFARACVCVCNSSQRRWKKFRGNDRGNESGPSEIVDLLSRVGGGFEFAVNRKLSVPRTHKTCTPRIRTLFHELRFSPRNISDQVPTPAGIPCCFLEFFQPSFLIFFARYFPHGDEIFSSSLFSLFFLICRSPSFVCVFETTK